MFILRRENISNLDRLHHDCTHLAHKYMNVVMGGAAFWLNYITSRRWVCDRHDGLLSAAYDVWHDLDMQEEQISVFGTFSEHKLLSSNIPGKNAFCVPLQKIQPGWVVFVRPETKLQVAFLNNLNCFGLGKKKKSIPVWWSLALMDALSAHIHSLLDLVSAILWLVGFCCYET